VTDLHNPLRHGQVFAPVRGGAGAAPTPRAGESTAGLGAADPAAPGYAVLQLVRYRPTSVAWGLSRLALGARGVDAWKGLRALRILGSGREGGFGVAPSWRHQGLFAMFDDEAAARSFAQEARALQDRASRSAETFLAVLAASAARGSWGGVGMRPVVEPQAGRPLAGLTRWSLRMPHAATFWGHSPGSESALRRTEGCRLAVGLGEAPLLRQATFSLWDTAEAMQAYSRHGSHGDAARRAFREGWFSEWMFVRFVPLMLRGSWAGQVFG